MHYKTVIEDLEDDLREANIELRKVKNQNISLIRAIESYLQNSVYFHGGSIKGTDLFKELKKLNSTVLENEF